MAAVAAALQHWLLGGFFVWLLYLDYTFAIQPAQSNMTEEVKELLQDYNKGISPPSTAGPTRVAVDIYVLSLSAISEKTMDYALNMYIRERWQDTRLATNSSSSTDASGILVTKDIDKLWMPDLFIKNDKVSSISDVTVTNEFLRLLPTGELIYSQRVTSTVSCAMHLRRYPFDIQNCGMLLESYGYSIDELEFYWKDGVAVEINPNNTLPEHIIDSVKQGDCTTIYNTTGSFSCIEVQFVFRRNINYYVLGLFIPSILIVLLSWVGFFIDKDSTPGRVCLSLLTILTMQNQMTAALTQLPKVSYIKLVDVYLTGCLSFVFAGFLEFALVNKLATEEKRQKKEEEKAAEELEPLKMSVGADGNIEIGGVMIKNGASHHQAKEQHDAASATKVGGCCNTGWRLTSDRVDYYSRFLFPAAFLIFNLVLWCAYLVS